MRVYAHEWLGQTMGLRPEAKGAYVTVAMYASQYPDLDGTVPWPCVRAVLEWKRRRPGIERDLKRYGLIEVLEDGSWRLCELDRTDKWIFLGREGNSWYGRRSPLLAIRPGGWADVEAKRRPIPRDVRQRVIERDEGICGICAEPVDPDDVHIDHVVPVVAGGRNDIDNLQVAHSGCNLRKGARV